MWVHIGTQIQTVFGRVDGEGNVVEQVAVAPCQGKPLTSLTPETFGAALGEILSARTQLRQREAAEANGAHTTNGDRVPEEGEPCQPPSAS
jgi:hypothetical protein